MEGRRKILSKGLREKFSGTDILFFFFKKRYKKCNTSRKLEKNGRELEWGKKGNEDERAERTEY